MLSGVFGQVSSDGRAGNVTPTGVPFLLISPDARHGLYEKQLVLFCLLLSMTSELVNDANLTYLNFQAKTDERTAIGLSLRYFNLGKVDLADADNTSQGTYNPYEYAFDTSVARSW